MPLTILDDSVVHVMPALPLLKLRPPNRRDMHFCSMQDQRETIRTRTTSHDVGNRAGEKPRDDRAPVKL